MIGQTDEIAPADRKLYALRDVTGTVEFIPFIAASIMSKKLAEGIDALVLDVKSGRGAFIKEESEARRLAETLADLGEHFGKPTVAQLTAMDTPLGRAVGNWPETAEAIRCLQGEDVPDLMEVVYALAGEMLHLGGAAGSPQAGIARAREAIASGAAFERFVRLVEAQGGDPSVLHDPGARDGAAPVAEVRAPAGTGGYVEALDALQLGRTARAMGAGRMRKEEDVDPTAGLTLNKKPGDPVDSESVLAWIHTRKADQLPAFRDAIAAAYTFGEEPPEATPRLLDRYTGGAWASHGAPATPA
jgi:pyrimidine-nucleoside phosphorylase